MKSRVYCESSGCLPFRCEKLPMTRFELMRIYLQRELKIFACEVINLANSLRRTQENSCKQYLRDVYLRVHYEFIIIFVCWVFKYPDACPSYYPYECK